MANSSENETIPPPINSKYKKEKKPSPGPVSINKLTFFINRLALVIAVSAIVITLCNIQFSRKLHQSLLTEKESLAIELQQLKIEQANSLKQASLKANNIEQSQNDLQNKLNQVNKLVETALSQKQLQTEDWQLLKARYYLELAQINTHWSDNYTTSIALLKQADQQLIHSGNPKIFPVRQEIAKEIVQLKAIAVVDIAGLLSQLDAVQTNVNNLTLQHPINTDQNLLPTDNSSTEKTRWQKSIKLLEKLVVLRKNEDAIKPLMSPMLEFLFKMSISLNLQEAQWAILNNNATVYQLALKQATITLKKISSQQTPSITTLTHQLDDLQKIKLVQIKPAIGQALTLLNQVIEVPLNTGEKMP